jgi:diguanylate cyclase (GGDEF)-like protein
VFSKNKKLQWQKEQSESNPFYEERLVFNNMSADSAAENIEATARAIEDLYKDDPEKLAEHHAAALHELVEKDRKMEKLNLENEKLYRKERAAHKLATTDKLTQIPNRLRYDLKLDELIPEWERNKRPFCLILIDIDDFKKYNDTFGHDAGDEVLKAVAKKLKEMMPRKTDLAARYGGEEFVVLATDTDIQGALVAADRLVEAISKTKIKIGGQEHSVTISAGVAAFKQKTSFAQGESGRINDRDELFKAADIALYHSKERGKNTASEYEKEMTMPQKMKIRGADENLPPEQKKEKLEEELSILLKQLNELKEEFDDRTEMLKELKSEKLIARTKQDIANLESRINKTNKEIESLNERIEQIEIELQKPEAEAAVA